MSPVHKATAILAASLFCIAACQPKAPSPPPNIIFIMADDHAWQAISA